MATCWALGLHNVISALSYGSENPKLFNAIERTVLEIRNAFFRVSERCTPKNGIKFDFSKRKCGGWVTVFMDTGTLGVLEAKKNENIDLVS